MFIDDPAGGAKNWSVPSLTVKIRPASRSALPVLASVSAAFRQLEHVTITANERLTELPGVGTVLVTELPGEVLIHVTEAASEGSSTVREAVTMQIRQAAGSRSAAARLVVIWAEVRLAPVRPVEVQRSKPT